MSDNPPKTRDTGREAGPKREDFDRHVHPDIQRERIDARDKAEADKIKAGKQAEKNQKKRFAKYRRNPGAEMPTAGLGQMGRAGAGLNHILGPGLPFPRAHLQRATPLLGEMPRPVPRRSHAQEPRRNLFLQRGSNPASLFGGSGSNIFGGYADPFSGGFSKGLTMTPGRATRKRRRRK